MSTGKADRPAEQKPGKGVYPWLGAGLTLALAIVLLACLYFTVQIIVNPQPADRYSELYLLGPEGMANDYPREMVIGENKTVIAQVINHEDEDSTYNLAVRYNNSSAEETAYLEHFTLQDNASWRKPFELKPDLSGSRVKIQFQLYKNGDTGTPYRECYLWLNVSKPYSNESSKVTAGK